MHNMQKRLRGAVNLFKITIEIYYLFMIKLMNLYSLLYSL